MTLLPCAVLLCAPFVRASLPSLNDTSFHTLDASNCPSCNTRTLWDILLSCALTLFACTWTAIHPNIPGMNESKVAITSRRLFIMVIALIAPELMITWATRQFFSARDAGKGANRFISESTSTVQSFNSIPYEVGFYDAQSGTTDDNDRDMSESQSLEAPGCVEFHRWTVTHGFFAWMGGFMLYVNDRPRATLTPHELMKFVRNGSVDMPVITEAEIEDRSKGDGLSKGIAVLQLAWFIAQLVARYIQNLPITLLEIDTLAVAVLTCIAYALWWKKPKDVGCPYIVHLKATATLPDRLSYEGVDNDRSSESFYRQIKRHVIRPFVCLMGITAKASARSRRVPSLGGYANSFDYHQYDGRGLLTTYPVGEIILFIGCFSGMVFGGVHCLGWDYFFHNQVEHILWRATSLLIICAPVVISLDALAIMWHKPTPMIFGFSLGQIAALIYITARVTLIVLMIMSLQSLPTGVYNTVAWTTFIPHL